MHRYFRGSTAEQLKVAYLGSCRLDGQLRRSHSQSRGFLIGTLLFDCLGHTWETTYNLADQVVSTQQPATGQQGSGRVTVQSDYVFPGGPRTDVTVLDEAGAVVQHVNHQLGAEGEVLAVTGGTEAASYEYDALYRQVLLTDGNGHSTIFRYDSKGRLALIRYPLANADTGADTVRFSLYDDAGRLLRRIDGRDIVTEYDYDEPGGALTAIRYPADPDSDVEFTYDALGRRVAMTDPTGEHAYTYDDGGRLLSHEVTYTGLDAKTIAYEYYPNGSRSKLTTPAGDYDYTYDAGGRLTALDYDLGTAEWTYLDNGALATQTLPNGCVSSYDYNAANQLVGLLNQAPDSSTLSSYGTMLYRGTGDLTTVTSTIPGASSLAGVVDYAYDLKRQLTLEDSTRDGGYDFANTFDDAGNATTFRDGTQTFNANNQLTGPGTYVYDGNGNPTTFAGTALTWDDENRLTSHGTALDAAYRGDGLRAWKEGAARTYFLYDGINVVCELDADGDLIASSTFGAAGLLSRGAVQYQFDPLGDAVHLLDGDGDVLSNRLFDAWGNELTTGPFNPRGYRARYGYYTDVETGLVALAYRYYAPGVGRFLNRDPIRYSGAVRLYGYAGNSVSSFADPSGLLQMHCKPAMGTLVFTPQHCWLHFEHIDCYGTRNIGFYPGGPNQGRSLGSLGRPIGPGQVIDESPKGVDHHGPLGRWPWQTWVEVQYHAGTGSDMDYEVAVCNCIHGHGWDMPFILGYSHCSRWADTMARCPGSGQPDWPDPRLADNTGPPWDY